VASHDLKEPVRKIKTFTNRVKDDYGEVLPDKVKDYLNKVSTATNRMYAMIDGILSYSKLANTKESFAAVDLDEIINTIETDLEVLIQQKNAVITTGNLPVITADKLLIYQLFYNLVLNSLKFSKQGEPVLVNINSDTDSLDQPGFVKIVLTDTGIGFEPEYAQTIFETFARLNAADEYEGTGLGLALCKKIVERHGGSISATGEPGIGTKFTVLLPL
jgi:light-regulated signal transduction histidine kinase (bacteriophytochrome)